MVVLGILASIAIPRLAGTREDAETATAIANLRTLVGDASAYHTITDTFADTRWDQITKVPLQEADRATNNGTLTVGGRNCITVRVVNKTEAAPAHMLINRNDTNGVCAQVLAAAPVAAYLNSTLAGVTNENGGVVPIGSSINIFEEVAFVETPEPAPEPAPVVVAAPAPVPAPEKSVVASVPPKPEPKPKPPRVTFNQTPHLVHRILGIQTGNQQAVNAAVAAQRAKQQTAATKEWEKDKKEKDMAFFEEALKQIQAGSRPSGPRGVATIGEGEDRLKYLA
ncbi:MAG: hypothetical protein SPH77_08030 [Campylobacter sp.]|uniref:hypothetical protein n=1 Tax=Campylobacter sp. TaxID=205 RepID=UPI002A90AC73|nr:hypothetical protein [Campylobacter sp.]MDY6188762.1 hypothetical protein [Campylobacter sp.]